MTRLGSLILCITVGTGLFGCSSSSNNGGTSKSLLELVPAGDEVPGWSINERLNKSPDKRAMTGKTVQEVGQLIDGAGEAFFKGYTPKEFAWQIYKNTTLPAAPDGADIDLYVLQMPSADQASGLYSALANLSEYAARSADGWTAATPSLGAESRIQDAVTAWWINFHKDVFYVEVKFSPSAGPGPNFTPSDPNLKAAAVDFARTIADKI